jgi:hypothetical protein
VRRLLLILIAVLPLAGTAACEDNNFFTEPVLRADTLVLRAPTAAGADAPSALNASVPSVVSPERPQFAGTYDYALRQNGSTFSLLPVVTRTRSMRPGLQASTQAFDRIQEASRNRASYADSAVVLVQGGAYTFRTRQYTGQFGECFNYGKLQVLNLDAAAGTARLHVVVNGNCDDERLTDD